MLAHRQYNQHPGVFAEAQFLQIKHLADTRRHSDQQESEIQMRSVNVITRLLPPWRCKTVKFLFLEDQESDATLGTEGALLAAVVDCNSTWSCCVSF